jgi:hypothetical protein
MIVPDPLIDLLPIDHPALFDRLPRDERRWRLRLYLACWGMGCPDGLSWAMALEDGVVHVAESLAILAGISDDAIRSSVLNRASTFARPTSDTTLDDAASPRSLAREGRAPSGVQGVEAKPDPTSQPAAPDETVEGPWDRLLRESRARDQGPSRITLLVPPRRSEDSRW